MIAEQVLRTAGVNAATALGVNLQIGRIAPGSSADLILVDGDPLSDIEDVQNIVGVVRNGRFFSVIGLIERVEKANSVE
jgi:imidazolonepropionase-like amidohydrolase